MYFREDELDTGYCQLHSMFVLRVFWCQKFLQHLPVVHEGGESQGSEESNAQSETGLQGMTYWCWPMRMHSGYAYA